MNDITTTEYREVAERDIETITSEIKEICRMAQSMALSFAIELGRRLTEAKKMLAHGEWGEWLKSEVEFSQSTANNYMRIFDEYGDAQISIFGAAAYSQTLGNLPYTKALKLLAIPADEREEFAEKNDVENISSRELDALIKERDEAIARAENAEALKEAAEKAKSAAEAGAAAFDSLTAEADALKAEIEKLNASLKAEKEAVEKAKNNPAKKVVDQIEQKAKEKAESENAAKIEALKKEMQKKLDDAAEAKRKAELAASEAKAKADELSAKTRLMNADAVEFKARFNDAQATVAKLKELAAKIEIDDAELAGKLKAALKAFFAKAAE